MSTNLVQMPARRRPTPEREAKLLGAMLHHRAELGAFESLGLASEDFSDQRVRTAWTIARKLAERKRPVSALTVFSAGVNAKVLTDADCAWFEGLELGNTMTVPELRLVAEGLRQDVRDFALAAQLEQLVSRLRNGQSPPGQTNAILEGLAHKNQRESAPDEDASGDVQLLDTWDSQEKEGKANLLPTGIKALDEVIGGFPQNLTLIAAGPGVGKSALLASIFHAQLTQQPDLRIGFFGLEDGTSWVTRRWMARATGMQLRDIGWKPRTVAEREKSEAAAEAFYPLLKRVTIYKHDSITLDELVLRSSAWVANHGVKAIYVDNLSEIDHRTQARGQDAYWERVGEVARRMRNLAIRAAIPVVMLVHTTEEDAGPGGTSKLAGGRSLGRRARLLLDLWRKGDALRCTVSKVTESASGTTIEFAREASAALVDPEQGVKVNLQQEAREERAARVEAQVEASEERRRQREAKRAKEKALEHDKAEAPQPTLFDGGES